MTYIENIKKVVQYMRLDLIFADILNATRFA